MKTPNTPGEWFVEDLDGSGEVTICYDARPFDPGSGFPSMIGSTFYDDPDCATHGRAISYDEARANAYLFAAAKDLLEVARAARDFLNGDVKYEHDGAYQIVLLSALEGAIDKAEGSVSVSLAGGDSPTMP